ncbi:MAG: isoprenylcysteine carboxylmethyltransferase family protein [Candidatus Micrarchaeia archaeon]
MDRDSAETGGGSPKNGLHRGFAWVSSGRMLDDFILLASVIGFLMFAYSLLMYPAQIFPDKWFPSQAASLAFKAIFSVWVLGEIVNSVWSRRNSKAKSQDRGSYWVVVVATWIAVFSTFVFRGLDIGTFGGTLQYAGLGIAACGIILRQWSIAVLGRHFTVRVQVREKASLITGGPYRFARHPSYTGSLMTFAGLPLAIGTWPGALLVFMVCMVAYAYRISVEEDALVEAFGAEYESYRKRTWKMFPGY